MVARGHLRDLLRRAVPTAVVLGASLVVAAGLLGVYHWLSASDTFVIRRVEISGNRRVSEAELSRLMALGPAANVFTTDVETLATRLETHPWIRDASVSRDVPDGLEVRVAENETVAAVLLGGLYLVDHQGRPFKRASATAGDLDDTVVITGLTREAFQRDSAQCVAAIRRGLTAIAAYKKGKHRPSLGEVHLGPRGGITLTTYERAIAIFLGSAGRGELDERLAAFDAAWTSLEPAQLSSVRSFRVADRAPSDRVTIAFAENRVTPWHD